LGDSRRQPLEDVRVTVSRAAGTMTFPAEFMLVAALNPCPCGFYGDPKRECRCTQLQVQRYRDRISGPLLDRIDLHLEVPATSYQELAGKKPGEASAPIRSRIEAARTCQRERFSSARSRITCNARMSPKLLKAHCTLDEQSEGLLRLAMTELNLSARAYDRILKVARTIADLDASGNIAAEHLSEAIQYRSLDRNLFG
jgi:magnesium chelatase family protein